MPRMYQKKRFKGKKLNGCQYEYSTWMGQALEWVDTFRDVNGEKILNNYYQAKADYEEKDFQRKINNLKSERQTL